MAAPQTAMKKRQVIANSNKTMFVWVAIMSALVGVCAVLAYFLTQQIIFKTSVVDKLDTTAGTLSKNNADIKTLVDNVRVLETSTALNSVKARPEDKALQVILDALPADPNALALGSSLQQKLVGGAHGISIENLAMNPISDSSQSSSQISFTLTVKASDASALKDLLTRFEHSIRVIDIDTLTLERDGNAYSMSMEAHAYYQPAKTIQLTDKVVKP